MKRILTSCFMLQNNSDFTCVKMRYKRFLGFSSTLLLVFLNFFSAFSQFQITRDLKCTYVGNSFGGGPKWVQNFIENISVTKDGKVYTNSYWDEAHREYGVYTKCDVVGNADKKPNSLVATDCNGKTWTVMNPYLRFMQGNVAPVPTGELAPYIKCSDGREIRSVVDPTAIAVDNQCRLMVADNGPDQDIKVFDISGSGTPVVLTTIGDKGGALSGSKPGLIGPLKFWGIRGIGTDSIGNLWVANCGYPSQVGGGTDLRHFDTNLNMDCQMLGLAFVQSMDADPLNPTHIYSSGERYEIDYDAPAGDLQAHWKYAAQTLDPFKYPDDPRVSTSLESTYIRYIDGKKFMFLTNMYSEFLCVYRFDGEIAVPCAFFPVGWDGQWEKYSWQIDKRPVMTPNGSGNKWFWRDNNGDGQVQTNEFSTYVLGYAYNYGIDIDQKGNIYMGGRVLNYFPTNGLDQNGVPNYSVTTMTKVNSPFSADMTRIKYVDETDVMYFGSGEGYPYFSQIYQYKNWSKGTGTPKILSIGMVSGMAATTFTADDKYIYVCFAQGKYTGKACEVDIWDVETLNPVGYILPGTEVHNESGMIDLTYGIKVSKLPNGERILFVEEDVKGKNIIYKFSDIVEVVPNGVSISAATLNMDRYTSSQLTTTVTPEDASNKTVIWTSSDNSIATVNSTGLVTALAPGNVTITATTQSGGFAATCNVTISDLQYSAQSGTAYRWSGNTSSISNSNRVAEPGLNDGNLITDVNLGGGKETITGVYEAAGLVFDTPRNINKVDFINGTFAGEVNGVWDDGSFEADFKVQTSTNGTTWRNVSTWALFPAYPYLNTSVSGSTYTFIGNATNIMGIRVTGRVRNSETSGSWQARAREITAYSAPNTGIYDTKEDEIQMYPNPLSAGSLTIKLPDNTTELLIFDVTGKMIYREKVMKNEYLIDQSIFSTNGVYVVNVLTTNNSINKKLIVAR